MATRVTGQELDVLRDALFHWRQSLLTRLDIELPTLCHRHNAIVVSAYLGIPDLADVFAAKGKP